MLQVNTYLFTYNSSAYCVSNIVINSKQPTLCIIIIYNIKIIKALFMHHHNIIWSLLFQFHWSFILFSFANNMALDDNH